MKYIHIVYNLNLNLPYPYEYVKKKNSYPTPLDCI